MYLDGLVLDSPILVEAVFCSRVWLGTGVGCALGPGRWTIPLPRREGGVTAPGTGLPFDLLIIDA